MANEDIRCIVKCVTNFQDGNLDPSEIQKGEVHDWTEDEFHKFSKSHPKAFELIERKFLIPEGKAFSTLVENTDSTPDPPTDETVEEEPPVAGWDEGIDWKPMPWYAAQLAREPASEEA